MISSAKPDFFPMENHSPAVRQSKATGIAYLQGSEGLSDFASVVARSLGEADRPWIFC